MSDRTSIVVAHRLTTVEKCNRIAVLEGGKIVEEGAFSDLKNRDDGFFSHLAAGMAKKEMKEEKSRMSQKAQRDSFNAQLAAINESASHMDE